jgi:hypothetical protein
MMGRHARGFVMGTYRNQMASPLDWLVGLVILLRTHGAKPTLGQRLKGFGEFHRASITKSAVLAQACGSV